MVSVDLNRVIHDVVVMLEHILDKRIVIETVTQSGQCCTAGDPTQLQKCLLNLAINAKDAMPQMSGKEVFYALRNLDPEVKVIIASGYGMDKDIQNLLDNGVLEFVQKPFTLEKLSDIMHKNM